MRGLPRLEAWGAAEAGSGSLASALSLSNMASSSSSEASCAFCLPLVGVTLAENFAAGADFLWGRLWVIGLGLDPLGDGCLAPPVFSSTDLGENFVLSGLCQRGTDSMQQLFLRLPGR